MLYLSYGMHKSGSTLAFELTRALLERLGHAQERLEGGVIGERHQVNFIEFEDGNDERLQRIAAQVPDGSILVLKTHAPPTPAILRMAGEGRLLCQAVFRDPRDNVLSLLDAGAKARAQEGSARAFAEFTRMSDAIRRCDANLKVFDQWCKVPGVLLANYQEVAFDSEVFLGRVLGQVAPSGVSLDLGDLSREVKRERFTQFNKGVARRHRSDLSLDACLYLTARFAGDLRRYMPEQLDEIDRALLQLAGDGSRLDEIEQAYVGRSYEPPPGLLSRILDRIVPGRAGGVRR